MYILTITRIENSVEYTSTCINMPPPRYTYVYKDGSEYQPDEEENDWMQDMLTDIIEKQNKYD